MILKLEDLREQWGTQAWGIERTHGDDAPAGRAFRACIDDLYGTAKDIDSLVSDLVQALETCADPTSGMNVQAVAREALERFSRANS